MWNAEQYARFAAQRLQPSKDLAARLSGTPARILDVGCGSGLSTAAVRDRFPEADITGVDLSREMLERAAKDLPGVRWLCRDCSRPLTDLGRFDIVFSNAFLQWLSDQETFLRDIRDCIAAGGVLAAQVPDMNSLAVMECIDTVAHAMDPDGTLFAGLHGCESVSLESYYDMLRRYYSDIDMWHTRYYHVFDTSDSIVDFVKGTALVPYMERLTPDGREDFLNRLRTETRRTYPSRPNGDVLFPFPRIFFTARV